MILNSINIIIFLLANYIKMNDIEIKGSKGDYENLNDIANTREKCENIEKAIAQKVAVDKFINIPDLYNKMNKMGEILMNNYYKKFKYYPSDSKFDKEYKQELIPLYAEEYIFWKDQFPIAVSRDMAIVRMYQCTEILNELQKKIKERNIEKEVILEVRKLRAC